MNYLYLISWFTLKWLELAERNTERQGAGHRIDNAIRFRIENPAKYCEFKAAVPMWLLFLL